MRSVWLSWTPSATSSTRTLWPSARLRRGISDIEWIPVVGARGWVVITIDHHLRTRPYEAHLARKHSLKCVNLRSAGNLSRWTQLVRLTSHWDALEEFVTRRPEGPWWLSLTKTGRREYDYKQG